MTDLVVELKVRMAAYQPGQASWPTLHDDRTCAQCIHFGSKDAKPGRGRCRLWRCHIGKPNAKPPEFVPYARICVKFDGNHRPSAVKALPAP